jgi:hypothetical protein
MVKIRAPKRSHFIIVIMMMKSPSLRIPSKRSTTTRRRSRLPSFR